MTSSYNDVRSAIENRIATEMAESPSYPVSYQNVPYTPPNNSTWISVSVRFGSNNYATLLGPSTGMNRQVGTLVLNVYTPVGVGPGANLTVAERLKDLFDRQIISSIIFAAADGPGQVLPASPEGYFQTQTTITFEAYLE
jgi:hypothetical protein|tara:strand:- start:1373 stop:1792 length:420 start_codon:yes stop_codon:yes gene_type:complete